MLYMFDLDGTLIESYLGDDGKPVRPFEEVTVMPRRLERLAQLSADPVSRFAVITNQAGVAFGYNEEYEIVAKVGESLGDLGFFYTRPFSVHVCYEHPKATVEKYLADTDRRKPGAGMLMEAMRAHNSWNKSSVMIGDLPSDEEAARNAHVKFIHAEEFFRG